MRRYTLMMMLLGLGICKSFGCDDIRNGVCLNFGPDQHSGEEEGDDLYDPDLAAHVRHHDQKAREYLLNLAWDPATPSELRDVLPRCSNSEWVCTLWALMGKCENDRYHRLVRDMQTDCSLACHSCDQLLYENRCPLDPDAPNAWEPGDLNEFFLNLTTLEKYKKYEPTVWSRPAYKEGDTAESADYQLGPWIVSLDNVVSEEEANHLINIGGDLGYERSDDFGEYLPNGEYRTYFHDGRTSYHTWCTTCDDDSLARSVTARIEDITNIPARNYEEFQLLRYEEGQKYETHHDFDTPDLYRRQGVRMLTAFLYLNDVPQGGETNFPHLNITFTPRRGQVVIWPNVLDEDPHQWDSRTIHQAMPVIEGVKYAANSWIHQRDAQTAIAQNCYE